MPEHLAVAGGAAWCGELRLSARLSAAASVSQHKCSVGDQECADDDACG
jgi:hypothetical protein